MNWIFGGGEDVEVKIEGLPDGTSKEACEKLMVEMEDYMKVCCHPFGLMLWFV